MLCLCECVFFFFACLSVIVQVCGWMCDVVCFVFCLCMFVCGLLCLCVVFATCCVMLYGLLMCANV